MGHQLEMMQDSILRVAVIGDIDIVGAEDLMQELTPYLEAASADKPLKVLADAGLAGKMSASARHIFTELNKDHRLGHIGVYNINSFLRVFVTFIMKVTGRQNIAFFNSEEEAIAWLNKDLDTGVF